MSEFELNRTGHEPEITAQVSTGLVTGIDQQTLQSVSPTVFSEVNNKACGY